MDYLGTSLDYLGQSLNYLDDVGGTITERRLIRARRIWIEEAKERRVGGGTGGRMRNGGRHWETDCFAGPCDLRDY